MQPDNYRTVVFEITDPAKAQAFLSPLVKAMGESIEVAPGVRVTAVSMRDEITAVELLEAAGPAGDIVVSM
nr:hypothetical protein [Stenotrophomonas pavanii]